MGKKRIPVDKKQFEALKNELERVSGIDLSQTTRITIYVIT